MRFVEHTLALVTEIIVNPALPVPDSNELHHVTDFVAQWLRKQRE
ncbi:hypothetical protein [Atlantibacter sp.]|nr:hypothetical protein [Atlantibacter sp.]